MLAPPRLLCLLLLGIAATGAFAQQVENPGDIIVERDVTPRIAYRPVPVDQDPVLVRATTFPANTFDPMMATLVSDVDLTNAHGSSGLAPNGLAGGGAGVAAVTQILTGDLAGSSITRNPNGMTVPTGGIGGMISNSVTSAVAPITSALGGIR
nr:hypothetical protein [Burkholderia alba]